MTTRTHYAQIPHILDDSDLSPHAFRLYYHIKRVAGEDGECWQGTAALAAACKMSAGMVSKARRELIDGGWIEVVGTGRNGAWTVRIVDVWQQNHNVYAQIVHNMNDSSCSDEQDRSHDERENANRSHDERNRSHCETKNIKEEQPLKQEEPPPPARANDDPPQPPQWVVGGETLTEIEYHLTDGDETHSDLPPKFDRCLAVQLFEDSFARALRNGDKLKLEKFHEIGTEAQIVEAFRLVREAMGKGTRIYDLVAYTLATLQRLTEEGFDGSDSRATGSTTGGNRDAGRNARKSAAVAHRQRGLGYSPEPGTEEFERLQQWAQEQGIGGWT